MSKPKTTRIQKTPTVAKPADTAQIAAALEQTLLNAERGLQSFLASLQGSGLVEATGGYRQLQTLLLQQRLWAISQQRAELNGNFTRLARLAGELHRIFHAYAEILKPLVELDNLAQMHIGDEPLGIAEQPPTVTTESAAQSVPAPDEPARLLSGKGPARLFAVLLEHGACSPARAAKLAHLSRRKADKHLEKMAQAKIIERTGTHHNCGYQIAPSFVPRNQNEPAKQIAQAGLSELT